MKLRKAGQKSEKLSVSLSGKVHDWALQLAEDKGFGHNFSAYIAHLILRDQEQSKCAAGSEGDAKIAPVRIDRLSLNEIAPNYKIKR